MLLLLGLSHDLGLFGYASRVSESRLTPQPGLDPHSVTTFPWPNIEDITLDPMYL